jgi:hypothetical protein
MIDSPVKKFHCKAQAGGQKKKGSWENEFLLACFAEPQARHQRSASGFFMKRFRFRSIYGAIENIANLRFSKKVGFSFFENNTFTTFRICGV